MGTFRLVIKQMRQRALGTWLTLLSVLLGVALAIAILLLRNAGQALFGQTEYGYDAIVGIGKGSPTQLVMNTVYHIDKSPGNIPYWVYEQLDTQDRPPRGSKEFDFHRHVKLAVPIAVGDTYQGRPIVGTLPKMFVSLAPLQQQIDAALQKQVELEQTLKEHAGSPKQWPADLSGRQAAMGPVVRQIQQQIQTTDREIVPLLVPISATGAAPAFKYGTPAYGICDAAAKEVQAAADSIKAGNAADAIGHQDKAYNLLHDVYDAVSAATGPVEYRPGRTYELADGRIFHAWKFEAVIGSEVAQRTGLKVGSTFRATHGNPPSGTVPDIHPEQWKVVGILKPTHTASDRCLYIPLLTFYTITEHETGLKAQDQAHHGQAMTASPAQDDDQPDFHLVYGDQLLPDLPHTKDFIDLDMPTREWELSAILVKSRGDVLGQGLIYYIANGGIPDVQAVNPAQVMRIFFETFLKSSADILLLISLLVSVVAGVGILVSIYNSVSARTREIAILRALGATRGRVLTLICAEAVLIGLVGSLIGLLAGHALGGIASTYLNNFVGQGFDWITVGVDEWFYVLIVVGIALIAGLVPALKAYQTPVATNLVAS